MTYRGFKDIAPKMWAMGYRVLPIKPGTKAPSMKGWPGFVSEIPSAEKQAEWLKTYAAYGIGVLTHAEVLPGRVIVALDIDHDQLVRVVRAIFPNCTVAKRGRRGETLFGVIAKTKRIDSVDFKGANGIGDVQFLASGKQTVIDPSFHPDTQLPYEPVGRSITETPPEDLPVFTMEQVHILKTVLAAEQTATILSGVTTHEDGVAFVAKLVRAQADDDLITNVVRALLPVEYSGDLLEEVLELISSARAKGFGEKDAPATTQVDVIVNLIMSSGVDLFHSGETTFASVPSGQGFRVERINSSAFRRWVRFQTYDQLGKAFGSGPLIEAVANLDSVAQFKGAEHPVHLRVAGDDTVVEVDLGWPDGEVVRIGAQGWTIEPRSTNRFHRGAGFLALPVPVKGGGLHELRDLLALDEDCFRLLTAFMISAMRPNGPFLCLLIEGEQGSGKSFISHVLKSLLDPNEAPRVRLPDDERNLMVHAKQYRLLNYDNASLIKAEMSDALCSLATGSGVAVRRLYTDDDLHVMAGLIVKFYPKDRKGKKVWVGTTEQANEKAPPAGWV